MIDFYDKNRYRKRKIANRISNLIWRTVATIIVIVVVFLLVKICLPVLSALWQTIK